MSLRMSGIRLNGRRARFPIVVGNHRARKRQARVDKTPVMFEYVCSVSCVFQELGVPHVGLAEEWLDLSTDAGSWVLS